MWYYIALSFAILSSLGCLFASSFLVIYGIECQRRHEQEQKYFTVRTNGDAPTSSSRVDQRSSEDRETVTTTTTTGTAVQDSGGGLTVTNGGNMTSVREEVDAETTTA